MENKGVELQLNSTVYESDDLKFDLSYNVSINDNEVTRLDNEQNVGGIGFGAFLPVNNLIAFEVSGPEILITAIPDIPGPLDKA